MNSACTEAGATGVKDELSNATTGSFLSPEQQNYAVGRVNDLARDELEAFNEANLLPFASRPVVSLDERFAQLRDGKAILKSLAGKKKAVQLPRGEGTRWDQLYVFPKTSDQCDWDDADTKRRAFKAALIARRDTAIDQIMLGTDAAANDIIAGFGPGATVSIPKVA